MYRVLAQILFSSFLIPCLSFFPSRSRPPPKTILTAWLDQGQETTTKLALESSPLPPTTLPTLSTTTMPTNSKKTVPTLSPQTMPTLPKRTFPTFPQTTLPSIPTTTELALTSPPTPSPLLSHANLDQDPGVGAFTKSEMTQLATIGTNSVDQNDVDIASAPLKFEDIVDKKSYDKMRPPKPGGKPTKVEFHVTVMSLDSINEGSMTYAADIFFGQSWDDHRLKLPANMTSEYRLLPVEWLEEIWRPDSFFKNAKQVTFQRMTIPNHYLWLYNSKKIMYMVKLTLLLSCAMKFHKYPHDEQLCKMSMESISHTTEDLVFEWLPENDMPLVVDEGIELPQLELISNFTADCTSNYSTGTFTCLEVVFRFKRRLGYFMFHTYIPTCLIVMMSWISFWIKPEAVPARVTLGVTSLLTLSTQHANSQKSLPPVSYIKAIDMFMSSCTFFVFLSLIEYAFVNVMMGDISEIERKDRGAHMKNLVNHHKFLKNVNLCGSNQVTKPNDHIDAYRETQILPKSGAQDSRGPPDVAQKSKVDQNNSSEMFSEPAACPRHSNNLETKIGEISNFRHLLGLENNIHAQHKPRTAKDSKEIMKKRRERAICIDRVSRVLFPSTFVLLNIIYWLVFSDILESLHGDSDLLVYNEE